MPERTPTGNQILEPEIRKEFLELAKLYTNTFGEPKNVYYPGCGTDATPIHAFPNSTVVLVDSEDEYLTGTRKKFPHAIVLTTRAEEYTPEEKFDLVISIHSHAPLDAEIKDLKKGGRLIIRNKMADSAFDNSSLRLVAVTTGSSENIESISTDELDSYLIQDLAMNSPWTAGRKFASYYIFEKIVD